MNIIGRNSLLSIALMTALAFTTVARADSYTFAATGVSGVTGDTIIATLQFTATSLGGGYYGITGVSGTEYNVTLGGGESQSVTGMSYCYPNCYLTAAGTGVKYDNILNLSGTGTIFDQYGVYFAYTTVLFGDEKDLSFQYSSGVGDFAHYRAGIEDDYGQFTTTPEPSTWLLLGSGLLGLAGLAMKSRSAGMVLHS
jgi:hypothetical protein